MVRRALTAALLLAAFAVPGGLALGGCTRAGAAEGTLQAGLVVELPGDTKTFCVAFTTAEDANGFTGADLLERSGLEILTGGDRSAVTVCRIEGVGCVDPGRCFCECPVATAERCRFWGYYTLDGKGTWVFSQLGASARRVRNGDVDGWRYANHYHSGGAPAPASSSKLCAAGPQAVASRAEPTTGRSVGGTVAAVLVAAAFAAGVVLALRRRAASRGAP